MGRDYAQKAALVACLGTLGGLALAVVVGAPPRAVGMAALLGGMLCVIMSIAGVIACWRDSNNAD